MLARGHVSRVNSPLQALNLTLNVVRADGASAPEKTLKVNRALQSLNLSRNAVAAIGARALREALKENTMMQELELTNNDGISARGTTAFQGSGKPCTLLAATRGSGGLITEVAAAVVRRDGEVRRRASESGDGGHEDGRRRGTWRVR